MAVVAVVGAAATAVAAATGSGGDGGHRPGRQVATDWATARVWAAARAMGKDANGAAPERFGGLCGRLVVLVRLVLVWAVLDAKLTWFQAMLRSLFLFRSRGARAKEGVTWISESSYRRYV